MNVLAPFIAMRDFLHAFYGVEQLDGKAFVVETDGIRRCDFPEHGFHGENEPCPFDGAAV